MELFKRHDVPVPEFNESQPNGGDSLQMNVNDQFSGFEAHTVYIAACSFVVLLIIPGIAFLYSGLARRKSALTLLFQSMATVAVITVQWMFWGYSLAYSRTAGPFIGDFANFGMKNVMAAPSPGSPYIPEILFAYFQFLFCACTVVILVGGSFERGNILPFLLFGFCWATVVYCPIACWTWNANGWLFNLPSLDYAGGGPVHIASGVSALAYALVLGKRKMEGEKIHRKPHNTTLVFLGTIMIWFGWLAFNGGSTLSISARAMMACFNTNAAASAGMLGYVAVEYFRYGRKFSLVGACEGVIAGLVGITPAAGYVSPWLAAVIGLITGAVCALMQDVNDWLGIDESLDVFRLHGLGGMVGSFLTGIFAESYISSLDGATVASGAIDGNGIQVAYQLADIAAVASYSFVVSCILLLILKFTPGVHLRVNEEIETVGLDVEKFFNEQIGDWGLLEQLHRISYVGKVESTENTTPQSESLKAA